MTISALYEEQEQFVEACKHLERKLELTRKLLEHPEQFEHEVEELLKLIQPEGDLEVGFWTWNRTVKRSGRLYALFSADYTPTSEEEFYGLIQWGEGSVELIAEGTALKYIGTVEVASGDSLLRVYLRFHPEEEQMMSDLAILRNLGKVHEEYVGAEPGYVSRYINC